MGERGAWLRKAPPLVRPAFETLGPGQPREAGVVGGAMRSPAPSGGVWLAVEQGRAPRWPRPRPAPPLSWPPSPAGLR